MPWLLESIRATVFAPDIRAVGLPNWESLVQRPPAQTQNNREVDGTVEAGPYDEQWLTMGVARRPGLGPGRADLILAPQNRTVVVPLDPVTERIEPASIGPFTTKFAGFVELATRWLSAVTNVRRLALACTLFERADTPEEALAIVLRNVRSFKTADDDRIVDFLIQLNRPQRSLVNSSIDINRFARWSARTVEMVLSPLPIPPPTIRSERAQADLDISTVGEIDIGRQQIPDYIDELARLLREIAEMGDNP
jgi:hypothetical protein